MIAKRVRMKKILYIAIPALFLLVGGIILASWLVRPSYTVTFICNDWVVVEQKVKKSDSAIPPADFDMPEGSVFRGWDNPIDNIREDIIIRAILVSVIEENVFTLDSVYIKSGAAARMPLRLQGQVNLAGFELLITYPTDTLLFRGFDNLDKDMVANCSSENGEIKIAFASGSNVTGVIDICDLVFEAMGIYGTSEVTIDYILASQLQGDDIVKANTGSIPATVYFY